jgi:hypothetical protein
MFQLSGVVSCHAEMNTFTLWLAEFRGSESNILCLMSEQPGQVNYFSDLGPCPLPWRAVVSREGGSALNFAFADA